MPKVGMGPVRRAQLIQATLQAIDQNGLANTTIVVVAKLAGISTGIVSHYFGDKLGLLEASMRHILSDLWRITRMRRERVKDQSARAQLYAIIDANFDESQVSGPVAKTWLAFWSSSMHEPTLKRLQRVNDRRLYSNLCGQFRRELPLLAARSAATGLAALIDGLWLRGALSDGPFNTAQARRLAYQYVDLRLAIANEIGK